MKEETTITINPSDYIREGDLLHIGPYGSLGNQIVRVVKVAPGHRITIKPVRWWVRLLCWIEDKIGRPLWFRF